MSILNPNRVVTKQDLADFYEMIKPYLVNFDAKDDVFDTSYDVAYGAANLMVAKGKAALCGTVHHRDGTGWLYNTYWSLSSDIAGLTEGGMTSNYSYGTHDLVAGKVTYTNYGDNGDLTKLTALVDGYVVLSYVQGQDAGTTMGIMASHTTAFSFFFVRAGAEVLMPYKYTDDECTWVTFYERL